MLGTFRNHLAYLAFMIDGFCREIAGNPNIEREYAVAFQKMYCLNIDLVWEDFLPRYSPIGRPSNQQPELFRSLILMCHFKYDSIDDWVGYASSNSTICCLIGVKPTEFPGRSTHRDFVSRFWMGGKPDKIKAINTKPKGSHGKNKLPPKNPGIIKKMVDKAMNGETFGCIPERLYQTIFMKLAVIPSADLGLLGDTKDLTSAADGACVSSNANPHGHSLKPEQGFSPDYIKEYRRFADPLSRWGWDSCHERWYNGYTMYLLSVHNPQSHIDLPIYMRFVDANRFDGITLIAAVTHARNVIFKGVLHISRLTADSAHDNYPTYGLMKFFGIIPFIDLNTRTKGPKLISCSENASEGITQSPVPDNANGSAASAAMEIQPAFIEGTLKNKSGQRVLSKDRTDGVTFSENGLPICRLGIAMTNWGKDDKRHRIKFRCPLAAGSVASCKFCDECYTNDYGKTVYIKPDDDPRLYPPVLRGTPEWVSVYNTRTAAERVNNRILTDYQLERPKRYGKKKLYFFAMCNAINVHLDAQIKFSSFDLSAITA